MSHAGLQLAALDLKIVDSMSDASLVPRRYVPKESVPPLGLALTLVIVIVGVSALASGYALATFHVPFVNMLTLMAAPALAFGVAMTVHFGLEAGRIRSPSLGLAITVFAGVLALYVNWVVWPTALGDDLALLQLAIRPLAMARAIVLVAESGGWEIWDWTPSGAVLGLLWLIEAGLIVGVTIYLEHGTGREFYERPLCERCRRWLGPTETIACLELGEDDPGQLRASILAGDWSPLRDRASSSDEDNAMRISVGTCKCGELNVLAIERHTTRDGGYGCDVIAKDLLVDEAVVRAVGRAD